MRTLFAAASALFCIALSARAEACSSSETNTALDPTLLSTSASVVERYTSLSSYAHSIERSLQISNAISQNSQLALDVPFRNSLVIDGIGSAAGPGDLKSTYTGVLSCSERWRTAAIAGASFGTGNINFTSGGVDVTGSAAASYRATKWLRLIFAPSYLVPMARAKGLPMMRKLAVTGTAIAFVPLRAYASASVTASRVTGDYHFNDDVASFAFGDDIAGHFNVAVFYEMPIGAFTYDYVERSSTGVRLTFHR